MPDHLSSATEDHRVVSLSTRRRFRPAAGHHEPQPPTLEKYQRSSESDDFRHRMTMNAVAFVIVVVLVLSGVWLADTMATMRKTQDCVLAGKRGCAPVEAQAPVR